MEQKIRHILGLSGGKDSFGTRDLYAGQGAGDGIRLLRYRKGTARNV